MTHANTKQRPHPDRWEYAARKWTIGRAQATLTQHEEALTPRPPRDYRPAFHAACRAYLTHGTSTPAGRGALSVLDFIAAYPAEWRERLCQYLAASESVTARALAREDVRSQVAPRWLAKDRAVVALFTRYAPEVLCLLPEPPSK